MAGTKDAEALPPGGHYSGAHRIPNIKEFVDSLDREKKERDAKIDANLSQNKHSNDEVKEHEAEEKGKRGTRKSVRDPVTGRDVEIEDVNADFMKAVEDPYLSVPNANLGKDTTAKTEPTQSGEEYRYNQDVTAPPDPVETGATSDVPIHGEKTNILFHPTPSMTYEPMYEILDQRSNYLCGGIFLGIVVIGKIFGGRLLGLIPLAFCVASGVYLWVKDLIRQGRDTEWASEQKRGETAVANLIPESVEWMNNLVGIIWGLVNPELFAAVADTLEDVMQASVPGVIENVRVADISQGSNPIRILSLRALPDHHVEDMKKDIHERNKKEKDPQELAADEEGGDYYNLEVSFAYHAKPSGQDISSKARNLGMQLIFYLGIKGFFGVPFPIWVELIGLVGTMRIRLQMSPEPPFLKTVTFTLMGVPKVQAGCTPMFQKGVNILNLPLISNFVNWAIKTAASMYVAPKSMSLDLSKMLEGDSIKKETLGLGILFIRIHKATGLKKLDRKGSKGGGSDPYICVSFSKFGKPQYCTRVIQDNLNPVFEESCALLVTTDIIKADEQLSMELWDSDRSSADDVVGKVEMSIQKLIQHPGKMFPQVSKLAGIKADSEMPGELHWEVGFFGKTQFRAALRTDGKDISLPKELRDKKELQDDKGAIDSVEEDAVVHTPPDPLWPSGILSVVVEQIVNLQLSDVKGSDGNRKHKEYEPAREAGDIKEEQGKDLPSSYCTILVNDALVYKSRTKMATSKPIFNAGTEKFIRDWRSSIVTVSVRDSRQRQHDPVLGVVPLKISDVLQTSSQSSRWYPLDGGIGFGRVLISLLFRSVELKLPPVLLGWDVGTFEFKSKTLEAVNFDQPPKFKVKLRTGGSSATVKRHYCSKSEIGNGLSFNISGADGQGQGSLRLPVKYRYRSPIFFEFTQSGKFKSEYFASLWMQEIVDNEEQDFEIPIWKCDNGLRLSQNYITIDNHQGIPDINMEEVGRLKFRGRFKAGMDQDHRKFVCDNDTRETMETWEACYAEGVRDVVVEKEVPETVQKLHEASLTQGRDVLREADENEKQSWLAKNGTDWSGAFGQDPKELIRQRQKDGKSSNSEDEYVEEESDGDSEELAMGSSDNLDLGIRDATHGSDEESEGKTEEGTRQSMDFSASTAVSGTEASPSSPNSATASSIKKTTSHASQQSGESGSSKNPIKQYKEYRSKSRDLHRNHRGLMQWKPMRNAQFAKNEATFAVRRAMKVGSLSGREPDVETEV
ncbi:hypothetical protein MKZ38_009770 [Zalerion maritima]|uniref:Uncharacterized protein n=1 Tax=Zalerion maritima TaxID=339359 RepID=A0AAD5WVW3_9PEZI|nr:hypothetical protein MKZ38_009770 [Zalerion maritima]